MEKVEVELEYSTNIEKFEVLSTKAALKLVDERATNKYKRTQVIDWRIKVDGEVWLDQEYARLIAKIFTPERL